MRLVLASASKGRKELLSYLKIPFEIIPSQINEEKIIDKTPLATLKLRAKLKGEDVCKKLIDQKRSNENKLQDMLIISADSGGIINGKLIGKPKNYKDAISIFSTLSGKTHKFVTAIYTIRYSSHLPMSDSPSPRLRRTNLGDLSKLEINQDYAVSRVTFRTLSQEDIKRYLSITDYTRFAGGYAIASAQDFITKIEGSISNVIGLPLEKIITIINRLL